MPLLELKKLNVPRPELCRVTYLGNFLEKFECSEQKKTSYLQFFTADSEEKPILFVLHICGLLVQNRGRVGFRSEEFLEIENGQIIQFLQSAFRLH